MKNYVLIADTYSNLCYWQTVINVASSREVDSMLIEDFTKEDFKLEDCEAVFVCGNESNEELNELRDLLVFLESKQIPMYLNTVAYELYEQLNMTSSLIKGLFYYEMSILELSKMLEQKGIRTNTYVNK